MIPGRQMLAYGGNPNAAELSGISRARIVHAGAHAVAALTGGGRRHADGGAAAESRQPTIGDEWLIASFAAPVIGGAVLTGGHLSVVGTCLGVLVVALINQALVLLTVDPFYVQVLLGLLILAAVGLNRLREARLGTAPAVRLS